MNRNPEKTQPVNVWDVFPSLEYLNQEPSTTLPVTGRALIRQWAARGIGVYEELPDAIIVPAQPAVEE